MRYRLLEIMACPNCGAAFRVWELEEKTLARNPQIPKHAPICAASCSWAEVDSKNYHRCMDCISHDIQLGVLQCTQNHFYPIVDGIPRMLPNALNQFSSTLIPHLKKLPVDIRNFVQQELAAHDSAFEKHFAHTQKSFSSEWEAVSASDNAWGQDIATRRNLFLRCFGIQEEDLYNKKVLDAGCGHGEVELALCDTDAEIFAVDLSDSVDLLQKRLRKLQGGKGLLVHLIQGNIHTLPLKEQQFDFVYSDGVLHHTPDTLQGFQSISARVKADGACYIWVYSNELKTRFEYLIYILFNLLRKFTVRLPHALLHSICLVFAPILGAYIHTYNTVTRQKRYIKRTLRELELSLFDALSPRYDWHHTTEEVMSWFASLGYVGMQKTYENHNGFGIMGLMTDALTTRKGKI